MAAVLIVGDDGLRAIVSATMLKPFDLHDMIALIRGLGDGLGDGHDGHDGHDGSGDGSGKAST